MGSANQLRGWDRGWKYFCTHFADLHEEDPSYLVVTRLLVGMLSTKESGSAEAADLESPEEEFPPQEMSTQPPPASPESPDVTGFGTGVLFIPNVPASYCLGACLNLIRECQVIDPERPLWLLESFDDPGNYPQDLKITNWKKLHRMALGAAPGAMLRGIRKSAKYTRRMRSSEVIVAAARKHFGRAWRLKVTLWIMRYHLEISLATRWLKKNKIGTVVTINDLVKPAAGFFAAAIELQVRTILLQHGVPGPHSAPFIAREHWSWGETSSAILRGFGAEPGALANVGNLEVAGEIDPDNRGDGQRDGPRRLLLFLQWRAAAAWGEPTFKEIVDHCAGLVKRAGEQEWTLHIRLHPKDVQQVRDEISASLSKIGIQFEFSPAGSTAHGDTLGADAVVTVCSSALAHAVALGKPHCQFVPPHLRRRIGSAFVADANVATSPAELDGWFEGVVAGQLPSEDQIESVLANRYRVVEIAARKICKAAGGSN